jgi:hypothetical protein
MKQQNQVQDDQQSQSSTNKALSRRKFLLQATAVSVPAAMSLKSGNAWGCVKLNCAPGEESLSNSGSQVASVTEGPNKIYERPRWPTMGNIRYAFEQDFIIYLMGTYNEVKSKGLATCKKSVKQTTKVTYDKKGRRIEETVYETVYVYTPLPFDTHTIPWWEAASTWDWDHQQLIKKSRSNQTTIYVTRGFSDFNKELKAMSSRCYEYNKSSTLLPAMYKRPGEVGQGTVISNFTPANVFSSNLPSTPIGTLIYGESLASYVVAAIVGSMWERHPSYKGAFDSTNPNRGNYCFPSPEELIAAYDKVVARSTSGRPEDAKAKDDMLSLFKLYMVGIK